MKVKRKSPIKVKKQKLINRINGCKKLSELEAIERTLQYYPVLSKDYDWDYGFFIDLIEFKLKRMRNYFWTHNIVVNEKLYGDICDKLINILHAGYKTNIIKEEELNNIYVNDRNKNRFFHSKRLEFMNKPVLKKYYLPTIREEKAKALFWKLLEHKIEELWD